MMSHCPSVTLLMCVYNGERYLREAVESILRQTFKDFEFLIIDDASTDSTAEILREFAESDDRIRIEKNAENLGLTRSLNEGLDLAKGKYIARMDADDVSLPERLEKQKACLEKMKDVGIVASACRIVDDQGGDAGVWMPFETYGALRWHSLFSTPFPHSSVMICKTMLESNKLKYDENIPCSQDFDLWGKILAVSHGYCIQEPLLLLRKHEGSVSSVRMVEQRDCASRICIRFLRDNFPELQIDEQDVPLVREMHLGMKRPVRSDTLRLGNIMLEYLDAAYIKWSDCRKEIGCIRRNFLKSILYALRPMEYFQLRHWRFLGMVLKRAPHVFLAHPFERMIVYWKSKHGRKS